MKSTVCTMLMPFWFSAHNKKEQDQSSKYTFARISGLCRRSYGSVHSSWSGSAGQGRASLLLWHPSPVFGICEHAAAGEVAFGWVSVCRGLLHWAWDPPGTLPGSPPAPATAPTPTAGWDCCAQTGCWACCWMEKIWTKSKMVVRKTCIWKACG